MHKSIPAAVSASTNPYEALVATIHENCRPRHNDLAKGQVFGGTCNRPGCETEGAMHWDGLDHAFYCAACADDINAGPAPSCEIVAAKPSLEEMNLRRRYLQKAYRR